MSESLGDGRWGAISERLFGSARLLVYLSAVVLLGTFLFLLVWALRNDQPLGPWQWIFHSLAIGVHAVAISFMPRLASQPRLAGFCLIGFSVLMAFSPAGMFHIGFWPETGLLGAAGILCLACSPMGR